MGSRIHGRSTSHGRNGWLIKPGGVAEQCAGAFHQGPCAASSEAMGRRPFPNTRRCSHSIGTTWTLFALAHCKLNTGSIEEVIPLVERAIRTQPPRSQYRADVLPDWKAKLLQSRVDEAISWLERARSSNSEYSFIHAFLAAAYGLSGDSKRAAAELAEARRLQGDGSYSSIAGLRKGFFGVSKNHALFEATFFPRSA